MLTIIKRLLYKRKKSAYKHSVLRVSATNYWGDQMKKTITKSVLTKQYFSVNRGLIKVMAFVALFCLVCILIIPNPAVGWGVALFVLAVALCIGLRIRKQAESANPKEAYFRLSTLTYKECVDISDDEINAYSWQVEFDGDYRIAVDKKIYDEAETGKTYYVAFYIKTDKPFAFFDADVYTPDGIFEIRN